MNRFLAVVLCSAAVASAAPPARSEQIKRGEYLVKYGGCNDCHTPSRLHPKLGLPIQDMSRMLSGHPEGAPEPVSQYRAPDFVVVGPTFTSFTLSFGTVLAPNLTPDKDTGLGMWTEEMFVTAIRTGKHMGGNGRLILPPMPWPAMNALTDEDLKAMFAYLQSIPAIRNEVPQPDVPQSTLAQLTEAANKM